MKTFIVAAAFIASGLGTAIAADLVPRTYTKAEPLAAPYYNWTGFYIGGNVGGVAAGGRVATDPTNAIGSGNGDQNDIFKSGVTGGAQVGYNWQASPNWVLGIEGDFNWLGSSRSTCDINDCNSNNPLIFTAKTDYLATVRGRIGYAWDRSLLYVTGGLAIAGVNDSFTNYSLTEIDSHKATKTGYVVGGGIETALWASNWTVKAEYLYANVGANRVFTAAGDGYLDFTHEYHVGRLGLNYRFGGSPVVANY